VNTVCESGELVLEIAPVDGFFANAGGDRESNPNKQFKRCPGDQILNGLIRGRPTRYYRSALYSPMRQLDRDLTLWAAQKYKKLRRHLRGASHWLARIRKRTPGLFAHWQLNARHGSIMGAV
jgi:hypothetical protein